MVRIPAYRVPLGKDPDHNKGSLHSHVSNDVFATRRHDLNSSTIETLWLDIMAKSLKLFVCNCYRPPTSGIKFLDVLQSQLDSVKYSIRNATLPTLERHRIDILSNL